MSAEENKTPPQTNNKQAEANDVKSPKVKKNVRVTIATPYTEELVVSTPSERNWRGILIALLVIVAVLGLIVFSIVLVSPPEEGPRVKGKKPDLSEVLGPGFKPRHFNGTWISDTEFVFRDIDGGISVYNAENLTTRVLMTNTTFRQLNAVDYKVSNDLRYVLLISDIVTVYTYTTLARYYVVEIATRQKFPLSNIELDSTAPLLQYATWSPNSIAISFIHNNDVYYKPKVNETLVCRITKDGIPGVVFNGIPDWLYEHEILKTDHSLWFSNDGKFLMYATYNDTNVGEYKYPWYDSANPTAKYPQIRTVRYPKVDTPNPEVTVHVVNLKRPKYLFPQPVKPTNSVETDSYITHVSWYSNHQVAVVWLNRRQNVSVIATCKSPNFTCTNLYIEKAECGWTEPIVHPIYSRNGQQCLARLPVQDGHKGNYMHACQINSIVIPITHGTFEVTQILAWDEDNHMIYAMATGETDPAQRHLYKIGDTNSSQPWTCITCVMEDFNDTVILAKNSNVSMPVPQRCNYNRITFSHNYRFYVQECLGPDIPTVYLVETATNYRIAELDTSLGLQKRVAALAVPQIKRIGIEIENKYRAQVRLLYPPGLREYEEVTFPLILLVDSKPGSQSVSEKWEVGWPWYLASNRNFIVAQIDGGGSGYQGEKMRRAIQHGLGTEEVADQLTVLKYLIKTFKFIDRTKVCAVGKGYGGYVTAMMLTQDMEGVINCSISIAPVVNWQFYNSYFTERYMGSPSENLRFYEKSDLSKISYNLAGRHYLLVHGTADTVVKPQHAMILARALVDQGVLFRQLIYPDEGHTFEKSEVHMYHEIDEFFDDSFGPVSFDDWETDVEDSDSDTTSDRCQHTQRQSNVFYTMYICA